MNEIEIIYQEITTIQNQISAFDEPSAASDYSQQSSKYLLLSCASYFETRICSLIVDHFSTSTRSKILGDFITNQALNRKYHSMFNWRDSNANSFFRLFGIEFSNLLKELIAENDSIKEDMRSFMLIGRERNLVVHNNFAQYSLQFTSEEIIQHFRKALAFVDWFESELVKN